ncbi:MAG: oxygen-independent coproporphyrinogen III oxidase [Gammaproteobacteria bacterium]
MHSDSKPTIVDKTLEFQADLLRRYDQAGPRYTSYPTAAQFVDEIGPADYRDWVKQSNEDPIPRPLSLYFHIPFCATVCFYCACNKVVTKNRSRAEPYLAQLQQEIAMHSRFYDQDRSVEQLHWGGGTPTFLSPAQMESLMETTARYFPLRDDDGGEYSLEIDPRTVTPATIVLLRRLGFNRLSLGVQDFNPKVQKAVNRIQSVEQTLEIMDAARGAQFKSINIDLIYGLPHQTTATFAATLDQIIATDPNRLAVYNYAHLPDRFPPQRRIKAEDLPSPNEKLDILQLAIQKLTGAGYRYIGMDHFAKPDDELSIALDAGTLQRNFQGYSAHAECDMVGMGVSSIGNVSENYYQNAKDLETYGAEIDAGRLPIVRGVELEPDDLLRSAVISQLMCRFAVDIPSLEKRWNFSFWDHFAFEREEIKTMEADGLLQHEDDSLQVLPPGRLLVRNICMVFDRYLRKESGAGVYSRVI